MKLWEMIKELMENPNEEFVSVRYGDELTATIVDSFVFFRNADGSLVGCVASDREWTKVKSPVSFMEAVKAQKPIRVEHDIVGIDEKLGEYRELDFFLEYLVGNWYECEVRDVLLNGKFYIED